MKIKNIKTSAFTLVELIVVIVIIGILATISIVSYSNISRKAITATIQSDLDADNKILKMYNVEYGYYPSSLDASNCPSAPDADNRYCLKTSPGNELDYTGSGQTYTLTETHTSTGISYEITEDGTVTLVSDGSGGGGGGSETKTFAMAWGGVENDSAADVVVLSDGTYVVAGTSYSFGEGWDDGDPYLAKYSSEGALLWNKTWVGTDSDTLSTMIKTSDGGFAVVGTTYSYDSGQGDAYMTKFTSDGAPSWTRVWGAASNIDFATSILQMSDDSYVIVGQTNSFGTLGDTFIVKYSSDGTFLWNKTWGGSKIDRPEAITLSADGGFVVAGYTHSFTDPLGDLYLLKYTADGTLSWNKTWGGNKFELATSVIKSSDDGYVVSGFTNSYGAGDSDAFISKFTSDGTLSWTKTWGGEAGESANTLINTSDGGYAIAGETGSYSTYYDLFIAKYTSDGTLSWSRTFGLSGLDDYAESIVQLSDGGYIAAGIINGLGAGLKDSLLARFKSDGSMNNCSTSKCKTVSASVDSPTITVNSPSATILTPSATMSSPTGSQSTPTATITMVVPIDPWPSPTITFSSQELYVAYPGDGLSACKEWTAPGGKQINGFYINHATEQDYDFFTVELDSTEKYNGTGLVSDEYIDVSTTPGTVLKACVNADSSTQDGFGGEVTGVYYK